MPSVEHTDTSRIVIVEVEQQIIGILVDSVAEVVNLTQSQIETPPSLGKEGETAKYIQGVYSKDDTILIFVDVNKLLTLQELGEIASF